MGNSKTIYNHHYQKVMEGLTSHGVLLGSYDAKGKPNLMTIGWGAMGSIWGVDTWMILVRPSRYTYQCIEHTGCFTINVPTEDMGMICAQCGSTSGKDIDKFEKFGLTHKKALSVLAPVVAECPIVYECQVVHKSDILPEKLADEIITGSYMDGDFHRIYFGRILKVYEQNDE